MYNAREGLIAHLETRKDSLGIAEVKKYAGEFEKAKENSALLMEAMPAVFVTVKDGDLRKGHGLYDASLIVASHTNALDMQDAATDAQQLAEALARDLESNFTWSVGGYDYTINTDAAIHMQTLFIGQDFTVVGLSFDLKEV